MNRSACRRFLGCSLLLAGVQLAAAGAGLGAPLFDAARDFQIDGDPYLLNVEDLNRDGYPDLLVTHNLLEYYTCRGMEYVRRWAYMTVLPGTGDDAFETLAPGREYPVSGRPVLTATEDVNRDHVPDVAVVSAGRYVEGEWDYEPGGLAVYLGNGDGGLRQVLDLHSEERPVFTGLGFGDFDGDGAPDLVVTSHGRGGAPPHYVTIVPGNGDGTFRAPIDYETGASLESIAVEDLDGDGLSDLVMTNPDENALSVWLNDGAATFLFRVDYPVGDEPESVAINDLDHDGLFDLITVNRGSDDVSILLAFAFGFYLPSSQYGVGREPFSVDLWDVNRDGHLDLIVPSKDSGDVSLLHGNGDGTFQAASVQEISSSFRAFGTGDVNRDNVLDLLFSNFSYEHYLRDCGDSGLYPSFSSFHSHISVRLGNGNGGFQEGSSEWPYYTTYDRYSLPLLTEDLNGDDHPDLVALTEERGAGVFLGNGDCTFQPPVYYEAGEAPAATDVGDLNLDGAQDLVVGGMESEGIRVFLGNGDGTFQPPIILGEYRAASLALGDLDGDGVLDMAMADLGPFLTVLPGLGDGMFDAPLQHDTTAMWIFSLRIGDVDGDEDLDLVAGGWGGQLFYGNIEENAVAVLLGNGDGTFAPAVVYSGVGGGYGYSLWGFPSGMALGDLDGDGDLDIAGLNQWYVPYDSSRYLSASLSGVAVFTGHGDGTFSRASFYNIGWFPTSVLMEDFDGDGLQDLAVGNLVPRHVSVLRGMGIGFFRPGAGYSVWGAFNAVGAGDLDGDGDADLVTADYTGGDIQVLVNQSISQFQMRAPADDADLSSAPMFRWDPGPYDAYIFYAVFPYNAGWYVPGSFWISKNRLAMPFVWWDQIASGMPCFWAVIGADSATGEWKIAGPWSFTKSP